MLLFALNRHGLCLMLPALLQVLDRINMQLRLAAQHLRFIDHGPAPRQTVGASSPQRCVGRVHRSFPLRLDLGKRLFTQVTRGRPLLDKTVEAADLVFPVGVALIRLGPGKHLVNQQPALGLDGFALLLDFLQPDLDHLVGFITSVVKTFPHGMVGCTALVAGFPELAHGAQRVLLLAPTQWLGHQRFCLGHKFFANLVGTPALPALKLTGSRECRMGGCLQRAVDIANIFFQRLAQLGGHFGGGLAVAFGHFMFEFGQSCLHKSCRFFAHLLEQGGIDFGFGRTCGLSARCRVAATRRTAHRAQLVSPDRYRRQGCSCVFGGGNRQCQRGLESLPHGQQLATRRVEHGRKLGVHAGPVVVLRQRVGLGLPVRHVGAQRVPGALRVAPGFGGQDFHALGHQYCGFALHLDAMLQVFDRLDAVGQLRLQASQRLA